MAVKPPPSHWEDNPFNKPGADDFINGGASYKAETEDQQDDDLKAKTIPSTTISLRIPIHMLKKINKLWKDEGGTLSRNSWILQIIQDHLKNKDD